MTLPGESLHIDVAGPVVPMGIGGVRHGLVVVAKVSRCAWFLCKQRMSQTARLPALVV